ncbi:MAG: DUF4760 domain-containing protein [Candidatus Eremiobacteraeota bacterium]|nr:DUF4760 domain-containing protein [Candidatus Eremiobacteraeota bacterium]
MGELFVVIFAEGLRLTDQILSAASVIVAALAMVVTATLLIRQNKQLEHERNALAILEAISRLTDPVAIAAFESLEGVEKRYDTDEAVLTRFEDSPDDRALLLVAQYFETVACLARRRVLDATLLVDAVGLMLRTRWNTIRPFVMRLRRVRRNEYIFENFEWIAMFSVWWKDIPRPKGDRNYASDQFAGVAFKI